MIEQVDAFSEITADLGDKQRQILVEKIKNSQQITKKLKKLLKQLNSLCDKKKEILECCENL